MVNGVPGYMLPRGVKRTTSMPDGPEPEPKPEPEPDQPVQDKALELETEPDNDNNDDDVEGGNEEGESKENDSGGDEKDDGDKDNEDKEPSDKEEDPEEAELAEAEEADPEEADPEAADPEETDPEEAEPEAADSEGADPEEADPEGTDPEVADPEEADPEEADPEEADPEDADPEEADPEEPDPEDADPEEPDPEEADPEEADPEEADPEEADPEEADPEGADPDEADPDEPGQEEAKEGETDEEKGEADAEDDQEEGVEREEIVEEEVEKDEVDEAEAVPDELVNEDQDPTEARPISRIDEDSIRTALRGHPVVLRIPPDLRDSYDTEATLDAPDIDYEMNWAYGCPQAESLKFLYSTGEMIYPTGSVIVLYSVESHSQRFYTGHTNEVTCLTIHPNRTLIASGQAEGHGEGTNTVQKPHIQLWNYEDLSFIQLLGIDQFETSLKALAFSDLYEDFVYLASVDTDQSPNLRVWKGFQDDGQEQEFVGKVKAYSDAVENVYFYPEPSNIMLTIGKSHVTMWNIGEELQSRAGLFTRKIPRPKIVTCATFAKTGEVLTGDSDGNVMIWRGVKVVRVLKGAHAGAVGDILVMDDGSFVSGGLDDASLVIFNDTYDLIGAGANLPEELFGGIDFN